MEDGEMTYAEALERAIAQTTDTEVSLTLSALLEYVEEAKLDD